MNWKARIFLLYTLVGLAGVVFVEFQNLVIWRTPWQDVLKYNLPFVMAQNLIFITIYYFYTVKKLKGIFQMDEAELQQLPSPERKVWFDRLVLFPYKMYRFSIIFMMSLALSFHIYEFFLLEEITREFFVSLILSLLRETCLIMMITLLIVGVLSQLLRPYILKLKISASPMVQLPLSNKIYFIFFSIFFVVVTDIIWLLINIEGSIEAQIIEVVLTICFLSLFSIVVIKLTVLDSINHIQTITQLITNEKNEDRSLLLRSTIPVTSIDEIAFLIGSFNKLQSKAQRLYAELEDELKFALTVQQNLLPKGTISVGSFLLEGLSLPVKEVGGDFFDFIKINDQKMVIVIGDVSGKGVPSALLMSAAIGVIRGKTQSEELSPAEWLNECNRLLMPMLSDGMYVTMGIGVLDIETNTFTYASAGHVPPLMNMQGKIDYFNTSTLPIGIDENETYEEQMIPLNDLDGIIFYTDGIIEQVNDKKEIFGFEKFHHVVQKQWNKGIHSIIEDIKKFYVNTKQSDDMTIVTMKKKIHASTWKKSDDVSSDEESEKNITLVDIKIQSKLGEEKKVLKELDEQLSKYSFLKEDCEEFKVAVAEICTNAIEHGNEEKEHKLVHIVVTLKGNLIQSTVSDEGTGFIFEEKEQDFRGCGLKIVKHFVDDWTMYHRLGNPPQFCVHIEKRLRPMDMLVKKDV
ncbi:ATP-binding SpoIIE family protein phosphatase [Calidifontibacillus erzurumensis]|uniref:SpoIIE family protein phosphatase n=1 Tax=Calidifontibacillus erzurumensis TaxID=2741433 RepID=A0A8J8KCB5_9BACI|nr:SpoIIE family protein phosphatase [Calidifontibacillus erzurumensis]NSL51863.1 SpoIIE family protein phosphatase [Calidifontibacillus erzurumensis]